MVDAKTGEEIGRIGDLSLGGMMLLTKKQLSLQSVYDVEINMQGFEGGEEDVPVRMRIETCWQRPDFNRALTCIGSRLVAPDDAAEHQINDLIDRYAFKTIR